MLLRYAPRIGYDVEKSLCAECRAYLLGRGVYALHTAMRLATQGFLDQLHLGVCQLQLATIERRSAKNKVLASYFHALLNPLYARKPRQLGRARSVGNVCREALLTARASIAHTCHTRTYLHQRTLHTLVHLGDAVYACAVDVTEGVVAQ